MTPLPIDPLLPEIVAAVRARPCVVLRAEPGAGKTTRVPAALVDAGLGEVTVLEPRRIAARAAAEFVARERRSALGGEVGYRVRFEHRGGPSTRLWFVTDGMFGRDLARDPFLERTSVLVLDEFHERHLTGDVALAVVRELQQSVRPDLRLVVMSATLDTEALARHLGDVAVITATGRAHPVAIAYDDVTADLRALPSRVLAALGRLGDDPGDVLVFLPGAAEIRRTAETIAPFASARGIDVVTLHGDQPLDAQAHALRAGPRRRIVLATNVAETALTVEGVTAVVDSGLARAARLDARHGINVLRVVPISRAAADQRAGRAGRTAPGRCLRLWTRGDDAGRRAHETPEVLRLDLSRTLLELRAWGLREVRGLGWLDPPPAAAIDRAERLLVLLGALEVGTGAITGVGRRMLALPVAPRLARMLVEAERRDCRADGALVAALASERDVLRGFGVAAADFPPGPSDLLLRLELFRDAARRRLDASACRALGLEPRAVHAVERARRQLARLLGDGRPHDADADTLLRCILAGYPDRVARRRVAGAPQARMVGATGVVLARESVVRDAALFVAVDVERGTGAEAIVRIASAVREDWLDDVAPGAVHTVEDVTFDPDRGRVVTRVRRCFHDLPLAESVRLDVDPLVAGEVLAAAVREEPAAAAAIGDGERALLARVGFLATAMPELTLPEPAALLADVVAGLCAGRRSLAELRRADVGAALRAALDPAQRAALEREAPAALRLPSGRAATIAYEPGRPLSVGARIQEVFGLAATPRLARGRVPLVVELLAPSGRPVQITDDLASFWRTTYAEVRKQLRGRYPKHAWPEDPTTAPPTSRPSRRR